MTCWFRRVSLPYTLKNISKNFIAISDKRFFVHSRTVDVKLDLDGREVTEKVEASDRDDRLLVEDIAKQELVRFIQSRPESTSMVVSSPFVPDEIVELDITAMNSAGQGMAVSRGWVVLVSFVIPGEKVLAKIKSNHPNYSLSRLHDILRPSSLRQPSPCKYFGRCNSCQYLHLPYQIQLKHKAKTVFDIYSTLLGPKTVIAVYKEILSSPKQLEYRSKMTPHIDKVFRHRKSPELLPPLGFNDIEGKTMDIEACPLTMPEITSLYQKLRRSVLSNLDNFFGAGSTFCLRRSLKKDNGIGRESPQQPTFKAVADPNAIVTELICGYFLRFNASSFFQVNPVALERAILLMKQEIKGMGPFTNLLDVYSGSGVLGIALSPLVRKVVGIEIDPRLVESANANAKFNQLRNCEFIQGDSSAIFASPLIKAMDPNSTVVVLDPPRSGVSEHFLTQLLRFRPKGIIYMSCFPWTQALDAKKLLEDSGQGNPYRLRAIQPMDFFPQTTHIECLISISRDD